MLDVLHQSISPLLAFSAALAVVLGCGPWVIRCLARHCRETIRQDSLRLHALLSAKAATPTMGGVLILAGFLIAYGLAADLAQPESLATVGLAVGLGLIGAWDDIAKQHRVRRGLSAATKLAAQTVVVAAVLLALAAFERSAIDGLNLACKLLVIVGLSNAVNLADGLDGLAGGCVLVWLAAGGVLAWCGSQEDSLVAMAALAGAVLAFLHFNRHPARVFMGDTGSLPLGGLLGWFALQLGGPLPLLLMSGVFVAEAVSVVLQVGWFRSTGSRLLLCAPLHHHFQFLGWPERSIVHRFWLAGVACAVLGLVCWQLDISPSSLTARADSFLPLPLPFTHPVQP